MYYSYAILIIKKLILQTIPVYQTWRRSITPSLNNDNSIHDSIGIMAMFLVVIKNDVIAMMNM